jgi:hypothetical protein
MSAPARLQGDRVGRQRPRLSVTHYLACLRYGPLGTSFIGVMSDVWAIAPTC